MRPSRAASVRCGSSQETWKRRRGQPISQRRRACDVWGASSIDRGLMQIRNNSMFALDRGAFSRHCRCLEIHCPHYSRRRCPALLQWEDGSICERDGGASKRPWLMADEREANRGCCCKLPLASTPELKDSGSKMRGKPATAW